WQAAPAAATPHRPTHELPETHCPASEQTSPAPSQLPQEPPQPSSPHSRPLQSGVQLQTGSRSQTPWWHRSAQQSPPSTQSSSHGPFASETTFPQRPTQESPATHWVSKHTAPESHSPQLPPQPSSPQTPGQSGVQGAV